MKHTTKIVIAMIAAIIVSLIICIVTNAEEAYTGEENTGNPTAEGSTDGAVTEISGQTSSDDEQKRKEEASKENADTNSNLFELFFIRVMDYSAEIFCALTLVCSLLLAYAYKKGLLPFIQSSLLSLGTLITKMKDRVEKSDAESKELSEGILLRIENTEDALSKLREGIERLSSVIDEQKSDADERHKMRVIINAQIDMLYDIFMSSSLPQYQKDAVGQRVMKMKEALDSNALE